jgi:hypothetical protein
MSTWKTLLIAAAARFGRRPGAILTFLPITGMLNS